MYQNFMWSDGDHSSGSLVGITRRDHSSESLVGITRRNHSSESLVQWVTTHCQGVTTHWTSDSDEYPPGQTPHSVLAPRIWCASPVTSEIFPEIVRGTIPANLPWTGEAVQDVVQMPVLDGGRRTDSTDTHPGKYRIQKSSLPYVLQILQGCPLFSRWWHRRYTYSHPGGNLPDRWHP